MRKAFPYIPYVALSDFDDFKSITRAMSSHKNWGFIFNVIKKIFSSFSACYWIKEESSWKGREKQLPALHRSLLTSNLILKRDFLLSLRTQEKVVKWKLYLAHDSSLFILLMDPKLNFMLLSCNSLSGMQASALLKKNWTFHKTTLMTYEP